MKITSSLGFSLLFGAAALLGQPFSLRAAEEKAPLEAREPAAAPAAAKAVPFQGKVAAVDLGARTFILSGKTRDKDRVFRVSGETPILQNNQSVEFAAIAVGELVRGQAFKRSDGWEAKKVMIGPKAEASAAR
jgi:hypothetical protein